MATKHESEILAVVANDVKHLIGEVSEIKAKVVDINGGLRRAQTDIAVVQAQGKQHHKCIEDLYAKYGKLGNNIVKFLGIGAAVGAVVAGVLGFIAWMAGMI